MSSFQCYNLLHLTVLMLCKYYHNPLRTTLYLDVILFLFTTFNHTSLIDLFHYVAIIQTNRKLDICSSCQNEQLILIAAMERLVLLHSSTIIHVETVSAL